MRYEAVLASSETPFQGEHRAIRYVEHCVFQRANHDRTVHNYLVSLYAKQDDEEALLRYIDLQLDSPVYDPKYALRLCHQENKRRSCVKLYCLMGLYEVSIVLFL